MNISIKKDLTTFEGNTIYQVYPRSFSDSNSDGTGDLEGITNKLEYISSLGVDFLWISPFFTSPMKDFGYDVSNYKDVDPIFGNLADFDRLMEKANKLGLGIMLDLVLAHSSDKHPWFIESKKDKTNKKKDWYIWVDSDSKDRQKKPNNWLSVFGGSAWTYDEERGQYYLHKFLKEQPNLNFFNEEVENELIEVCKFWLDRGVKGFRLDTVNFYYHDRLLRDNPISENTDIPNDAPEVNPYINQEHIYDKNRDENLEFLKKLRNLSNKYDAILLGEVGAGNITTKIIKQYTTEDKLHLCYGFDFIGGSFNAKYFKETINNFWNDAPKSMICNSFGNHDSKRIISRWKHNINKSDQFTKMCCALLLSLKGATCIYQGEELGLSEYDIKKDEIQDPYGLAFYPKFKGRDGCRTPFVWDNKIKNCGFSQADKTWLPIPEDHINKSVNQLEKDKNSLLNFYRRFINFKNNQSTLKYGTSDAKLINDDLLKINRTHNNSTIECIFNFSDKEHLISKEIKSSNVIWSENFNQDMLKIFAYGFIIFSKEK